MKKVFGILLSLTMLLSMATVPAFASSDGLDITEIGGVEFFSQGFDGASMSVGDVLTASTSGFAKVTHTTSASQLIDATFVVDEDIVNGASNKVMRAKPHLTMIHVSDEMKALFEASTETVKISSKSYKLLNYDFDGDGETSDEAYALVYYSTSKLYWVEKALIVNGVLTSTTERKDLGYWFYMNDDKTIKAVYDGGSSANAEFDLPKPSSSGVLSQLAYQFDFTYPTSSAAWGTEEGFMFYFDSMQYYVNQAGIKCATSPTFATGETTSESKSGSMHAWVAKGAESSTPYFVASANKDTYLEEVAMSASGVWHKIMLKIDMLKGQYTFYYDGKPVYFKTTSGYSCKVNRGASNTGVPTITVRTERLCLYADREPLFDNFKGYYVNHVVEGLDITDITGATKYFGQNFDDASIEEGDKVTTSMGFTKVEDTDSIDNVKYTVAGDEITDSLETSNRVMEAKPNIVMARATEAQYNALVSSSTSIKWGTNTYKVIDFVDGYYLASMCTSRNTALYWIKKSSVTDGVLTSTTRGTDQAQWFYTDSNKQINNIATNADASSFTIPTPSEGVGSYAIQFDFAYPSNSNMFCGEEGFDITIDSNEFHIRNSGIVRSGTGTKTRELYFDGTTTSVESENTNKMVPKMSIDIAHYFSESDYSANLTQLSPMYTDGQWNTVMVYFNLDDLYYTFYINGLPVYAKAANGGYSCRYKLESNVPAATRVRTSRFCVYNDHAPVFDNFLAYESLGTDQEMAERTVSYLRIPYIDDAEVITSDILFEEEESKLVTWSFDKSYFEIDEDNPLIARYKAPFGYGSSTVVLTATCTLNDAVATRDFTLTVKDRTKYEIDSVYIKDASNNRTYRPIDNSVIESVGYSAHSPEIANLYLAIYGTNGKLKVLKKGTPESGKAVFNQDINAGETYEIFVWEDGKMSPLTLPKTDTYVESENPTIFVIGDSIAATYSESSNLKGWGQYLYKIFNDNVTVDNSRGIEGRSAKYALDEDSLKYVLDNSKPGDYLFIMLGHNDMKTNEWYGASIDEYKILLEQIMETAKSKGVEPVLLTQLARPTWYNGVLQDTHGDYPEAAKEVAEKTGSAIIDIDVLSRAELARLGESGTATAGYYNPNDTHTTSVGADWVVGMIKSELAKMNLPISKFLK